MSSILTSTKKMLGIEAEYKQFDPDIIMHINSVFMILNQLGVGPSYVFTIEDDAASWEDFLESRPDLVGVKTYMYLKVRLLFDPPMTSAVMSSMKEEIAEFEWRMNVKAEEGDVSGAQN